MRPGATSSRVAGDRLHDAKDGGREDPIAPEATGAPLELFERWEQQSWTVDDLPLADDRRAWEALGSYARGELRDAIENFLVGESAVTETLPPLVHAAPTPQEQLFLATQVADEARHAVFFARYIAAVEGASEPTFAVTGSDSLTDMLDNALRGSTSMVRKTPENRDAWYRSVVVYHLLVEGVLAVSGMRTLLTVLRDLGQLPALMLGLTNVARDESRHIGFGVGALRAGVGAGYGPSITLALSELVPSTVRALVNPDRSYPALAPDPVRRQIARELTRLWQLAEGALLGRVRRIGLDQGTPEEVRRAWTVGLEAALDEYQDLHGSSHPVRCVADPDPESPPLERA